ncbi:MAG: hypothetical protein QM704_03080 [Anaeromyxobacteraceae bacterium]
MPRRKSRRPGPSRASLREIPEIDFSRVKVRRNPYAARIALEGGIHVRRGRPAKGHETGPTEPRSIRFPNAVWKELEAVAKARGLSLHSAMRRAILEWAKGAR